MKCWLVTIGEPLPSDGGLVRLLRAGTLASFLSEMGHTVTWWTSTFDHYGKRHRFPSDVNISPHERVTIKCLHSVGYQKNVSVARICNHAALGLKFYAKARSEPRPDIAVASLPSLELPYAACRLGREIGIPVVVDVRDLWPDSMLDLVPRQLRQIANTLLKPYAILAKRACRMAAALVGSTEEYVAWALHLAERPRSILDRSFPFAYSATAPAAADVKAAHSFWSEKGVAPNHDHFVVSFVGTIGRQFDIASAIVAARALSNSNPRIKFVFCGTGEFEQTLRRQAADCSNVIFAGWVNRAQIWTLLRMSSLGFAPYHPIENFELNIPNKPIEYLSAGLPILHTLSGSVDEMLKRAGCGIRYAYQDPRNLEAVLLEMAEAHELVARMAENAALLFRSRFQAERVYPEFVRHLELIARMSPTFSHPRQDPRKRRSLGLEWSSPWNYNSPATRH